MQKLNVAWNASSCWPVSSRSSSLRAAAMASSSDVSSLMTQFFMPFDRVLICADAAGLAGRGRLERVSGAAALAEGFGQDLGHHAPGVCAMDTSEPGGRPNGARV